MATIKYNYLLINRIIAKSLAKGKEIDNIFQSNFEKLKEEMLRDFDDHDITKELEGGATATNISNTLGGYGNLYSFIGFRRGSRPVEDVKTILENQIQGIISERKVSATRIQHIYSIRIPLEELERATPYEWEPGRSWLFDIEKGISGFSYFMVGKFKNSRSGGGIQEEEEIRSDSYRPRPYLNQLLKDWARSLQKR